MLKKTMTYLNFNGDQVTEDLYFNLTTAEIVKLEADLGGDVKKFADNLLISNNLTDIITFVQTIILNSYGEKSQDGSKFLKNARIREEFECSMAYAELFEELMTDPKKAEAFAAGIGMKVGEQDHKMTLLQQAREQQAKMKGSE